MADYETRITTIERQEIALPLPTNRKEIYLALRAADNLHPNTEKTDDTYIVTSDGEELVISWEVSRGQK